MGMRAKRDRGLTPYTRVPYGPVRPSVPRLAMWLAFVAIGALPVILYVVFLVIRGGQDVENFM